MHYNYKYIYNEYLAIFAILETAIGFLLDY